VREDRAERGGIAADLATLARGGLVNLVGLLANSVIGFLLVVVITRGLSPDRAGVFFEAVALFSILASVVEFGVDDGLVRAIPRLRALGRTRDVRPTLVIGLGPVLAAGTIVGGVLFGVAPALSHLLVHGTTLSRDAMVPYLRIFAPFLPIAAVTTASLSATRGFGTMVPNAAIGNLGRPAARLLLTLIVVGAGLGSTAIALSWAVPVAMAFVLALQSVALLLRRAEVADAERPQASGQTRGLGLELWRFVLPRGLSAIFGITVLWLDTLLLGALRTSRQAAIYSAATRYLIVASFVLFPVQMAMGPVMSGLLASGSHARAAAVYRTATRWVVVLSWPVFLSLAVFAPFFLGIFGPGYRAGQDALAILAVAQLAGMATGPCLTVLLMGGRSGWTLAVAATSLVMNVGLNLILIPRWGMAGAAVAWSVSIVFNNLSGYLLVRWLMGLTPLDRAFPVITAACVLCYGGLGILVRLTIGTALPAVALFAAGATAAYAAILWRSRRLLDLPELRAAIRGASRRSPAQPSDEP
jgi:O-antigen/teichoic acid export membrane protein